MSSTFDENTLASIQQIFPAVIDNNFGKISLLQTICPELYPLPHGKSTESNLVCYVFNHTAGRFQHALGLDKFRKFIKAYPNKTVVILEFGVGDAKSAINNPPDLYWFELDGEKYQVIKFWYDIDFKFSAKTENDDSRKQFLNVIRKFKITANPFLFIEKEKSSNNSNTHFPIVLDSNFGEIRFQEICSLLIPIEHGESTQKSVIFYGFNHTAGRFQHALGVNKFREFVKLYEEKTIVILEFGVGDAKSAINNPPELSWFELDGKKYQVIKFWYDIDFKFSAKTENDDSREVLNKLIQSLD